MNADIFAEWLRRQGYRVLRTESTYWYEASMRVYQAFPYHLLIAPRDGELASLFWQHGALALRYSADLAAPQGKVSYHVIRRASYDLESLPRQARQNISRALEYARVEPIPMARLDSEGWSARLDTLRRQGREGAESCEWWHRLCRSAEGLDGFEAWGAIHEGELVASCLTFRCGDCLTIPHEQSATAHLAHRPNNGLFYVVTHETLASGRASEVFLCLESLDAPDSVDEFKFRMGYSPRPVRQRVVFHPLLAPFANPATCAALRTLVARNPGKPALAKVEGMFRFCLEGKRPAALQSWPHALSSQRDGLLPALAATAVPRHGLRKAVDDGGF